MKIIYIVELRELNINGYMRNIAHVASTKKNAVQWARDNSPNYHCTNEQSCCIHAVPIDEDLTAMDTEESQDVEDCNLRYRYYLI